MSGVALRRSAAAVAIVSIAAAACSDKVAQAPGTGGITTIALAVDATTGNREAAFAKVDAAHARVSDASGVALDTTLAFRAASAGQINLAVHLAQPTGTVGLTLDLLSGGQVLFRGSGSARLQRGVATSLDVTPAPVITGIVAPDSLPALTTLGRGVVVRGFGVFANGDTATDALSWRGDGGAVVSVTSAGVVTALQEGSAQVTGSLEGFEHTTRVRVQAVVARVLVAPHALDIFVDSTRALTAMPQDSDGHVLTRAVGWTSGNPGVATVDAAGNVRGVAPGQATVVATAAGKADSAQVTVRLLPVAAVAIAPSGLTLLAGDAGRLTATAYDAAGKALTGRLITWTSSDPTVATVDATGAVQAVAAGNATISATSEGRTGVAGVTVVQPLVAVAPASVSFSATQYAAAPPSQNVAVVNGGTGTLLGLVTSVSYAPGGPTGWVNARLTSTIAPTGLSVSVDPSKLAPGTYAATITVGSSVRGSGLAGVSVRLTVLPPPVFSISVAPRGTVLVPGDSVQLTATLRDSLGNVLTGLPVSWATTNPQVATVSTTGLVRALSVGPAVISATSGGKSGSATIQVAQPLVGVTPDTIFFAAIKAAGPPPNQSVSVFNAGSGTLSGLSVSAATYSPAGLPGGWLTTSSLNGTTAPASLILGVDPSTLPDGFTYQATLIVSSSVTGAGSKPVTVLFSVTQPILAVDTTATTFQAGDTTAHYVRVSNTGTGTLSGLSASVVYNDTVTGWLSASFAGGTTTAPATLVLRINPNAPAPSYNTPSTATVTVSSGIPGAGSVRSTVTYLGYYLG